MKKIALIFALLLFLAPVASLGDSITAIGPAVKLHAKPGAESRAIAYAGGGKTFKVVQTEGSGWFAVRLPNKQLGWVELGPEIKLKRARVVAKPPVKKTPVAKKTPVVIKPKKKALPKKKVVKKAVKPAEKKRQVVAAREVKTREKPPPPPPKAEPPKEKPVEKKKKGGYPRFIPAMEMEKITELASKGYYPAGIGILFGLICLVVAKVKNRNLIGWFTLGLYLIIIPLIILLVKKKGGGTGSAVLKIISILFILIWLGLMGGLYMFTQSLMQDKDTIQQKVDLYTKQIHEKSYKRAYLLLSPEGQRLVPLKRFVKQNETAYDALGDLKHYQLQDFTFAITFETVNVSVPLLKGPRVEDIPVSLEDKPAVVVYNGVFEKGRGFITFTLEKEGGLVEKFKPGEWSIKSVQIDSPKIIEYKRQMKKEEVQKKEETQKKKS